MRVSNAIRQRFEVALATAKLSKVDSFQHGCAIYAGPRLLALDVNSHCTHPQSFSPWTQHAEFAAILRVGTDALRGRKITLFSARVGPRGECRMSRPCNNCMRLIRDAKIANVVWWDWTVQDVVVSRTRDMVEE